MTTTIYISREHACDTSIPEGGTAISNKETATSVSSLFYGFSWTYFCLSLSPLLLLNWPVVSGLCIHLTFLGCFSDFPQMDSVCYLPMMHSPMVGVTILTLAVLEDLKLL